MGRSWWHPRGIVTGCDTVAQFTDSSPVTKSRTDLHIRLVRDVDEPSPAPTPQVLVPLSTSDISSEVRALGSQIRLAVTEPSMDRALRILQAIANECATREWTLDRDPRDDRRFRVISPECSFDIGLSEELVNREVPVTPGNSAPPTGSMASRP
jgi:hypothetical protein